MKHKKDKKNPKHEKKKSKRKDKKRHKRERKYDESSSSDSSSEGEEQWVERTVPSLVSTDQNSSDALKETEPLKREDWMNIKNIFPCVFNEKKTTSKVEKNASRVDLDKPGQSARELNPYWKNGGDGLPGVSTTKGNQEQVLDVNWLRKSFQRAKEQARDEGKSLEEVAAERWGSLDMIQSMIAKAEKASMRNKSGSSLNSAKWFESERRFRNDKNNKESKSRTQDKYEDKNYYKTSYKKPVDADCYDQFSRKTHNSGRKTWQKQRVSDKSENNQSNKSTPESKEIIKEEIIKEDNAENVKSKEIKPLTEEEMNKLGAKIVKAEIMGDMNLAAELRLQLMKARELGVNSASSSKTDKVETVILTQTDVKGVTRPLESRSQSAEFSENSSKRKKQQTHTSGKRSRHYFDDDKYSLQQLFQREKGRSVDDDDAAFVKAATKNMDMDEIFEEQITHVRLDAKQDNRERKQAIAEHKRLSKSLDNCRWCIDSKYMLKHMIITIDSEICLSLPHYASLTEGHCIITPVEHIACQLQLNETIWERLKMYKQILYKMFKSQDKYPVFYEVYKNRHKYRHMQLECVPLPKEIGSSAPMYFKKALLECETEWSMNKKVIDFEHKDVRKVVPNGLSYFMVEFETNKGYAHIIEDESIFPQNFAEEIIGGMLDLDHDAWRKPKKENFDQQREKVLKFTNTWKEYKTEIVNFAE